MVGKRDPYMSKEELRKRAEQIGPYHLRGAVEDYHKERRRNMKGDVIWECECGCQLKENPRNPAMGFEDWSGVLICPNCNRSMRREEVK